MDPGMDALPSASSIWQGTVAPLQPFPTLQGAVQADIAIVGGGITGLTLASILAGEGRHVVLLEARSLGSGSSGNSTGNLYETLSEGLQPVEAKWGADVARRVVESRREALAFIERHASRLGAECAFRRCPVLRYADDARSMDRLEQEYESERRAGCPVRLASDAPLPVGKGKALLLEAQAQFHPLAYVLALARHAAAGGCRIFEHSPVQAIDEDRKILETPQGSVRARELVLASHTPKGVFAVHAQMTPHREYGIAWRLEGGAYPPGIFWGRGVYPHSLRGLEYGGASYLMLLGENAKVGLHDSVECLERLQEFAREHFGASASQFRWSAQSYRSPDELPFIGRSPGSDLCIATGFTTDGLTYGTLAAMVIADTLLGRANRWSELYRARRFSPVKGARATLEESLSVASAFVKDRLSVRDAAELAELTPGTGMVVEGEDGPAAVHRAADGKFFAVSAKCPHMGCLVHWNEAESSWDCPCHGSRFDARGAVLEGPALRPLALRPVPEEP
jgi:glycine/D-amino acid oxidase-like deaminating enzyme/nitrite reductase/ring-hydroxylating ferredoxin subunit